jgi:hypothetical protein
MKQTLENLKQRIDAIMEQNIATKDRKAGFRIMVVALLITALFFIACYLLKIKIWV